jgi:hypothetical protein
MTPGSLALSRAGGGRDSFGDRGMPLLLATARKHKLLVSAYYEKLRQKTPPAASKLRSVT